MSQKLVKDEHGNLVWVDSRLAPAPPQRAIPKPVIGEALGCVASQVEHFRADAKLRGFGDIEWVEDKSCRKLDGSPGIYDCKAPNQDRLDQYAFDQLGKRIGGNLHSGQTVTADELVTMAARVRQQYPVLMKESA